MNNFKFIKKYYQQVIAFSLIELILVLVVISFIMSTLTIAWERYDHGRMGDRIARETNMITNAVQNYYLDNNSEWPGTSSSSCSAIDDLVNNNYLSIADNIQKDSNNCNQYINPYGIDYTSSVNNNVFQLETYIPNKYVSYRASQSITSVSVTDASSKTDCNLASSSKKQCVLLSSNINSATYYTPNDTITINDIVPGMLVAAPGCTADNSNSTITCTTNSTVSNNMTVSICQVKNANKVPKIYLSYVRAIGVDYLSGSSGKNAFNIKGITASVKTSYCHYSNGNNSTVDCSTISNGVVVGWQTQAEILTRTGWQKYTSYNSSLDINTSGVVLQAITSCK